MKRNCFQSSSPATMFSLNDSMRYLLYNRPTDMRKSFHTLSGIVTDAMGQDPCNGNVYIFINRARDRIKLLHWEPGGMVLYSKLLEAGTLGKPDSANDNEVCTNIEWRELVMIVEGIMEARDSRRTRLENLQKLRK
ncbi:IS66 family insertion sequence element accessory protein TnpB [Bacteroides acidifaciens]|uniref:IS66 family insertion sequence element accessory protein TnpB n=1 Tax=Bacteroides acidifaciens TaxID=85831 RepID=UPI00242ECAA4|nr:IS66 family insertion sequence element accessory protein TnpB [Bacteroides acidifaciens]